MTALQKTTANKPDTPGLVGRRLTIVPGVGLLDLDAAGKGELVERLAGKVGDQLGLFAARMREGLLAASVAIGLDVMGELMAAEVTELAGPKGKHNPAGRTAYRHGDEDGTVVLGGRKLPVRRPRVRGVYGPEVHLESYDTFAQVDLLAEHTVAAMLAGLSTRRYGTALEPVGAAVEEQACSRSRSAVSRRFRAATADRLAHFRTADLSGRDWLICFVDGYDFAGHTMVGALGVTSDGTKLPLGVVEGSTENATVVRGLVSGLRDRGLTAEHGILFVLDGGKALRRAVKDVYGNRALVQRCRIHKERNILDHLPRGTPPGQLLPPCDAQPPGDAGPPRTRSSAANASVPCATLGRRRLPPNSVPPPRYARSPRAERQDHRAAQALSELLVAAGLRGYCRSDSCPGVRTTRSIQTLASLSCQETFAKRPALTLLSGWGLESRRARRAGG